MCQRERWRPPHRLKPWRGRKVQLRTDGSPSTRSAVSALWGPKSLEHLVDLDLTFDVETDKIILRRRRSEEIDDVPDASTPVSVRGLISSFKPGCGRTGTDRQFFFINGRPCNPGKVQKAFNEVYRAFNGSQAPFIVADFILPTNTCDINVSPDKRTIFLHSEANLVAALKVALEDTFSGSLALDVQVSEPQEPEELKVRRSSRTGTTRSFPSKAGGSRAASLARPLEDSQTQSLADASEELAATSSTEADPSKDNAVALMDNSIHDSSAGSSSHPGTPPHAVDSEPTPSGTDVLSPSVHQIPMHFDTLVHADVDRTEAGVEVERSSLSGPELANMPSDDSPPPHSNIICRPSMAARPGQNAKAVPVVGLSVGRGSPYRQRSRNEPVQMVLTTKGAIWNMRKTSSAEGRDEEEEETEGRGTEEELRRRKKPRIEAPSARMRLRTQLKMFSQGKPGDNDDENEEDEEDEDQEQDRSRTSEPAEVDAQDVPMIDAFDADRLPDELDADIPADTSVEPSISSDGPLFLPEEDEDPHPPQDNTSETSYSAAEPSAGSSKCTDVSNDLEDACGSEGVTGEFTATSADKIGCLPSEPIVVFDEHCQPGKSWNASEDVVLHCDVSAMAAFWRGVRARQHHSRQVSTKETNQISPNAAGLDIAEDERAAEALSRVIEKADFAAMDVVGQFNHGFIIVHRRKHRCQDEADLVEGLDHDDLFIVDQHAADEKYNFETLQATTRIQSQKLFRPRPLELTAADEIIALENLDVFRKNGFEIAASGTMDDGQMGRGRLELVAQPVSKSTVFDFKDLEELLHLMQGRPKGQMVRCSKARAMFASRACRKSVMIGMPLSKRQMTSVVRHMGTMDQPWNCPHGRPTMRHLADLTTASEYCENRVNWATYS